eukprot:7579609-Ditylum_brightwellii.AAC.1
MEDRTKLPATLCCTRESERKREDLACYSTTLNGHRDAENTVMEKEWVVVPLTLSWDYIYSKHERITNAEIA